MTTPIIVKSSDVSASVPTSSELEIAELAVNFPDKKLYTKKLDGTVIEVGGSEGKEPSITAGTTSQYWRGDKTWQDFATSVRESVLTGLSTATNTVITATDTVLSAFGKLQKQISDNLTTLTSHTSNTSNPHSVTKSQVGLGNVDNTSDANKPVSTAQQTALDLKANASQPSWTALTLQGAWVAYGSPFASPAYYKDTVGIVHLKGLIKSGSSTIAALPSGYRPSEDLCFIVNGSGAAAEVFIQSGGNILKQGGSSANYFSLDGISFRAA